MDASIFFKYKFVEKFTEFKELYISTFICVELGVNILEEYQDNYGCEQFKDFYHVGLDLITYGILDNINHRNKTLSDTYDSSDFNIYENVYYPHGITEDDMDNFDQIMKECVNLWKKWQIMASCMRTIEYVHQDPEYITMLKEIDNINI